MQENVRVRFAPSPTGTLHLGGARTAIYNWAFARRNGGSFVLRIDDTDPERSTDENVAQILTSLRWLGIDWDEGPEVGGDHGPYFQMQRAGNYHAALDEMKSSGAAYPCFCSAEELASKREMAREAGGVSGYDRTCRSISGDVASARVAAGEPHVWRLAVPLDHGPVIVDDAVRGRTEFPIEAMDDLVLARTDGTPTYNFATVVDDADMEMTHIIRGDDHLTNTPRQILIFEALGRAVPRYAHLSMIWGADGKKLSKRHGATSLEAYEEMGYLPEAVLNYLALLGWSLDGETTIVPRDVLTANFSLDRISSNPAIFDLEKLEWMNGMYLRDLDAGAFVDAITPWLVRAELTTADEIAARREWFLALAPLVSERIKRLDEVADKVRFFFVEPTINESTRDKVLAKDGAAQALDAAQDVLSTTRFVAEDIEVALRAIPETTGVKAKVAFQAIRVAVTGSSVSPPLFESLELLGQERSLARISAARALIG